MFTHCNVLEKDIPQDVLFYSLFIFLRRVIPRRTLFLPPPTDRRLGPIPPPLQYRQRLLIVREQPPQQRNRDGEGDDLLRGDGQPQKGQIGTRRRHHPGNLKIRAHGYQDVGPAVGDHPRQRYAEQEAGIEEKLYGFDDLLLHCGPPLYCFGNLSRIYV